MKPKYNWLPPGKAWRPPEFLVGFLVGFACGLMLMWTSGCARSQFITRADICFDARNWCACMDGDPRVGYPMPIFYHPRTDFEIIEQQERLHDCEMQSQL